MHDNTRPADCVNQKVREWKQMNCDRGGDDEDKAEDEDIQITFVTIRADKGRWIHTFTLTFVYVLVCNSETWNEF